MSTHGYFYVLIDSKPGILNFCVDFLWLEMGIILKAAWKLKMRYLCNAVLLMVQQVSMIYINLSICVNPE